MHRIPSDSEEIIPDTARLGPMNNFLNMLLWQLDVFREDRLISRSKLNYPYKSYIVVLLNTDIGAKQSKLQAQMLYNNTTFWLEDVDPISGVNQGYKTHHEFFQRNQQVDMQGLLYINGFQGQSSMLLNGVDMWLKLWHSTGNFNLMYASSKPSYKVVLDRGLLRI